MPSTPRPATHRKAIPTAFIHDISRLFLAFLLLLAAESACAAELRGRVVGVADGDTITVLDAAHARHKVRLEGIDAPEKHQAFGTRSRQNLSALVYGKTVVVVWHKHDRYGRIIGKVLAPECRRGTCTETLDTGLAQIDSGLAWHYRQYEKDQVPEDRRRYALAEQRARAQRGGLWQDRDPTAPWIFRRSARNARIGSTRPAM
jgi:endonuclease YncB( thermonuclease family)